MRGSSVSLRPKPGSRASWRSAGRIRPKGHYMRAAIKIGIICTMLATSASKSIGKDSQSNNFDMRSLFNLCRQANIGKTDSEVNVEILELIDECRVEPNEPMTAKILCPKAASTLSCIRQEVIEAFEVELSPGEEVAGDCSDRYPCTMHFSFVDREENYIQHRDKCGFRIEGLANRAISSGEIVYLPLIYILARCTEGER
jgi:hypothetical protein